MVYPEGVEQHRAGGVRERMFVADDDGEIRGAVWLREHPFRIRGEDVVCGWLKYPVAESLLDARFSGVPASLIVQCLREQPRLFALGLGGHGTPLARMLKALRWTGVSIPMLARLVRPRRVLLRATALRGARTRRIAANVLAWSGLGPLLALGWDAVSGARWRRSTGDYSGERCESVADWGDKIWLQSRDRYPFIAARDSQTVEALLPKSPDILRLRVQHRGQDVGWVCVLRHDFSIGEPDRNFGTLTVGFIADALAAPEHAPGALAVGLHALETLGVDVVLSNQLHSAWAQPLREYGFLETRSNFALYASPAGAKLVDDWKQAHVNRGDCDGPLWYRGG